MLIEAEPRAFHRDEIKRALSELASFFYRQRLFITVTVLAVASASIALSYLIPPVYTASGRIVVERGYNPLLRNQLEYPTSGAEMANDVSNVMRSRPVIEAVVDRLRPHERPRRPSVIRETVEKVRAFLDRWGILTVLPRREGYIRRWSKLLAVEGDGDLLTISLTEEDGALAASAVNAIIDEYRRHYSDFFIDLFGMRQALDRRQEIFARTQSEMTAPRRSMLNNLAGQPTTPSTGSDRPLLQSGGPGPAAADVERNLRQLLAARARSELAVQAPSVGGSGGSTFDVPAKYNTMLEQLHTVRRKLDAAETQVRTLGLALGPEHPETLLAQATRASLGVAAVDLENELRRVAQAGAATDEAEAFKKAYNRRLDTARQRVDQARLYTQSDVRTISVRLAERAETPRIPNAIRLVQVLFGIAASVLFALGAAVIRDRVNLRIHSPQGIEAILKSSVLFVMPDSSSQAMRLRR